MGNLYKQTLKRPPVRFGKILASIAITIVLMNVAIDLIGRFAPKWAGAAALGVLLLGGMYCLRLVYRNLAQFEYRVIEDTLYLERSFGRANHAILSIALDDVQALEPYTKDKSGRMVGAKRMGISSIDAVWHILTYNHEKGKKQLLFQPDDQFVTVIQEHISKRIG